MASADGMDATLPCCWLMSASEAILLPCQCFCRCDKYRMFKYIRQCYLWNRTVHELNAYYHNVWKTRSTDLADEFLTMREEDATRMEYLAYV